MELWKISKPSRHWPLSPKTAGSTRFAYSYRQAPAGMAAGEVAAALKVPPNTLSFHFDRLRNAGLLKVERRSRSLIYSARYETIDALLGYLTENCCKGSPEAIVKNDGTAMLESMDMVKYIESQGDPIFTGAERGEIAEWADGAAARTAPVSWPRYPLLGLPEFATVAAFNHYNLRKRTALGDFVEFLAHTRRYISELMPELEKLDGMIESPQAINGQLSLDDIRVLPLLRSAAVVKGLHFPPKVRAYFETMLARTGYAPLPAI